MRYRDGLKDPDDEPRPLETERGRPTEPSNSGMGALGSFLSLLKSKGEPEKLQPSRLTPGGRTTTAQTTITSASKKEARS